MSNKTRKELKALRDFKAQTLAADTKREEFARTAEELAKTAALRAIKLKFRDEENRSDRNLKEAAFEARKALFYCGTAEALRFNP